VKECPINTLTSFLIYIYEFNQLRAIISRQNLKAKGNKFFILPTAAFKTFSYAEQNKTLTHFIPKFGFDRITV
jgi:hypothetical protein